MQKRFSPDTALIKRLWQSNTIDVFGRLYIISCQSEGAYISCWTLQEIGNDQSRFQIPISPLVFLIVAQNV